MQAGTLFPIPYPLRYNDLMKKCLLIGHPLGHSVSPAMHNAGYNLLNLDFKYSLLDIHPKKLKMEIGKLKMENIAGFNVTIPHKENIMSYLDEITKLAERIGAVNTVKNESGKLIGYNTDGPGFIDSLREDAGIDPENKKVVLLCAGGAGRAIGLSLCDAKIKSLIVFDPDTEKLEDLTSYLKDLFDIEIKKSEDLKKDIDQADLLVNASPVGMHPKTKNCPLPKDIKLHSNIVVYDIVYNPEETALLKRAKEAGAKGVSGLGMLVRQGALTFSIFTGQPAPYHIMYDTAKSALKL